MSTLFLGTLAVLAIVGFWIVSVYNRLISLFNLTDESWSGISVQLQRRYDLIPNLVNTVKGYQLHEQNVLENVTKFRTQAMGAQTADAKGAAEGQLTQALKTLFAVAENYPDLKANQNFLKLQEELSKIEDEMQLSRRYYNGTVRNYNVAVQSFPNNIVANVAQFKQREFFQLDDQEARKNPRVEF